MDHKGLTQKMQVILHGFKRNFGSLGFQVISNFFGRSNIPAVTEDEFGYPFKLFNIPDFVAYNDVLKQHGIENSIQVWENRFISKR